MSIPLINGHIFSTLDLTRPYASEKVLFYSSPARHFPKQAGRYPLFKEVKKVASTGSGSY